MTNFPPMGSLENNRTPTLPSRKALSYRKTEGKGDWNTKWHFTKFLLPPPNFKVNKIKDSKHTIITFINVLMNTFTALIKTYITHKQVAK